jgi:hypothetical protein
MQSTKAHRVFGGVYCTHPQGRKNAKQATSKNQAINCVGWMQYVHPKCWTSTRLYGVTCLKTGLFLKSADYGTQLQYRTLTQSILWMNTDICATMLCTLAELPVWLEDCSNDRQISPRRHYSVQLYRKHSQLTSRQQQRLLYAVPQYECSGSGMPVHVNEIRYFVRSWLLKNSHWNVNGLHASKP